MASTPNFNWSTPDNTGLVKNGALDIRTLGNAIDASLVDLKGGTTGQVLKKNSNTDMDFVWSADSAGMTNPMTTTGDTIYSSSGSTPARLGIGSTGQVLTVSGGVPTWATPAAGGSTFAGCKLWKSADQSAANNADVTLTFDNEIFDTDGFHSTSSNTDRITIPSGKAGKYSLTGQITFSSNSSGQRWITITHSTDGVIARSNVTALSGDAMWVQATGIASAAVGDYFVLKAYQTSGSTLTAIGGDKAYTTFSATYLGA